MEGSIMESQLNKRAPAQRSFVVLVLAVARQSIRSRVMQGCKKNEGSPVAGCWSMDRNSWESLTQFWWWTRCM